MSKKSKKTNVVISSETMKESSKGLRKLLNVSEEIKPLEITSATIKDDYCNYTFNINTGVNAGNELSAKGKPNIIEPDLQDVFDKLNVHLACIDKSFSIAGVEVDNIDNFHDSDIAGLYSVSGFQCKGEEENLQVILTGTKNVSLGLMDIKTPKIKLTENSNYKWWNELKEAIIQCKSEVELYKNGKFTLAQKASDIPAVPLSIGIDFEKTLENSKVD